jgi:hypothetical protein
VNDVRVSSWVELQERLFGETWHEGLGWLKRYYLPRDG